MADVKEQVAKALEGAVETAAQVAESVAEAAETAIEVAEAKAEAAENLNEQLTEAALRGKLGEAITELEDEVDQWQDDHEAHGHAEQFSSLTERCARLETICESLKMQLESLMTRLESLQPSSRTVSTETQLPSGTTVLEKTSVQPTSQGPSESIIEGPTKRRVRIL